MPDDVVEAPKIVATQVEPDAYEKAPADDYVPLERLLPYARNARTHSAEQVKALAAAFVEFGITSSVLYDSDSLAHGHGRIMAAELLYAQGKQLFHAPGEKAGGDPIPLGTFPAKRCDGWTAAQKRAYIIADNRLAEKAGWNLELLQLELDDLAALDFDMTGFGFGELDLADIFGEADAGGAELSENYSRKIEPPVYRITGEKPAVADLMDETKTRELKAEIAEADLPDDVRAFLNAAADRHTVFNFRNIAEFYAHADAPLQRLMERSALVIIDFDAAIENGFVRLAEGMMEQAELSKARRAAADEE